MFRSFFTTIFRGSSAVLCAVTIPPADLRSLSSYHYAVCGRKCVICVCLVFLSVGDLLAEPTISAGERPQVAHLLRSWVRIPLGAWIFVCCECRVLSGRCHCDELITRPEESDRLCCVVVCDLETSRIGAPYIYIYIYIYIYDISSLSVKDLM